MMTTLIPMYIVFGLLLVALAIPLYFEKIGPNSLYGFRVRKTLEHPEIWYPVNRYGARWLIASGLALVVAAVGCSFLPGLSVDVYALACLAVFVVVFVPGMFFTMLYMNSL
jgi:hypothetical protein